MGSVTPIRKTSGNFLYLVDAKIFDDLDEDSPVPKDGHCGLLFSSLEKYSERGESAAIVQFHKIVLGGLILARHVFRGLQRPLLTPKSTDGDSEKLIYTFKPKWDHEWERGTPGKLKTLSAPADKVFYVIVTPNVAYRDEYSDVDAWIETWGWVSEDAELDEAPTGWIDRYEEKLWTRS